MKKKKMAIFYSKIIVQIPKRRYYILSKIIIKRNRFFLDTDFSHRFDFDHLMLLRAEVLCCAERETHRGQRLKKAMYISMVQNSHSQYPEGQKL